MPCKDTACPYSYIPMLNVKIVDFLGEKKFYGKKLYFFLSKFNITHN